VLHRTSRLREITTSNFNHGRNRNFWRQLLLAFKLYGAQATDSESMATGSESISTLAILVPKDRIWSQIMGLWLSPLEVDSFGPIIGQNEYLESDPAGIGG